MVKVLAGSIDVLVALAQKAWIDVGKIDALGGEPATDPAEHVEA
jgi:hypothetical protein